MSAAPASSSSPKEDSNGGSSDAASASNIHPLLFPCDNLLNLSRTYSDKESTLSALKQLRARSTGFVDFYVKVFKQIVGLKGNLFNEIKAFG